MTRRSKLTWTALTLVVVCTVTCSWFVVGRAVATGTALKNEPIPVTIRPNHAEPVEVPVRSQLSARNAEWRRQADNLRGREYDDDTIKAWQKLIDEWTNADPQSAIAYLETLTGEPYSSILLERAMTIWLRNQPRVAITHAQDRVRTDPTFYRPYLTPLLNEITVTDGITSAISFVNTLPQSSDVYQWFTPVLAGYIRDHLGDARTIIDQVAYDEIKPTLHQIYGGIYATLKGWEALSDIEQHSAANPFLEAEFNGAISALYVRDPQSSLQWLEAEPASPQIDAARFGIAQKEFLDNPGLAAGLAIKIVDPSMREQAVTMALARWYTSDSASADAWALDSDIPVEWIAKVVSENHSPTAEYLRGKLAAAIAMADDKASTRALVVYYSTWKNSDPAAADAWLQQAPLSGKTKELIKGPDR